MKVGPSVRSSVGSIVFSDFPLPSDSLASFLMMNFAGGEGGGYFFVVYSYCLVKTKYLFLYTLIK